MTGQLGRLTPRTWEHVEQYPLLAAQIDAFEAAPRAMTGGFNWYPELDNPEKDSRGIWWVKSIAPRSRPRGGHCVAFKPRGAPAYPTWYEFYNQVSEGICVGEGASRLMSYFNRKMYQPRWLYDECKKLDGYDGEGTWVSVAMDVLRDKGHVARKRSERHYLTSQEVTQNISADRVKHAEGIKANRWARDVNDILSVLGYSDKSYVDLINSWGRSYPNLVRVSVDVIARLFNEDGEFAVATDR